MWISPSYQDSDFPQQLSLDDKIAVFEDRTLGWKLDIADRVVNGTDEMAAIQHSGYAALDIVFSYFEMIAKYEAGYASEGRSRGFFKEGAYSVFPNLRPTDPVVSVEGIRGHVRSLVDEALDIMYSGVRCGLYHNGITGGRVVLTGEIGHPIAFDPQNGSLVINPHRLVPALKAHFQAYVAHLRHTENGDLRVNFERRFDFDTRL